jgi:hypothetical protein
MNIHQWKVCEEASLSDHKLITFQVNNPCKFKPAHHRNVRKTDWESYTDKIESKCSDISVGLSLHSTGDIYSAAERLEQIIQTSYQDSCRLVKRITNNYPSWWNGELTALRRKARQTLKKAQRTKLAEHWDASREATRQYKRQLRYLKSAAWKKYCHPGNRMVAGEFEEAIEWNRQIEVAAFAGDRDVLDQ